MPELTEADRDHIARARELADADVFEYTGEADPVLAYARWAGQARDLLAELADRLERSGGS